MTRNAWVLAMCLLAQAVCAGDVTFTPLQHAGDDLESKPGIWFRPNLGGPADVLPLKTRMWATKESVTGGVALKIVLEKGSKASFSMEQEEGKPGPVGAGVTFYAKASKPLTVKVGNATAEVGTDWKKIDLPVAQTGNFDWKGFVLSVTSPIEEHTWLILDRIGTEAPTFDANPKIDPKPGPDDVLSSKDMLYGAENLAKTVENLKAKKPFKIIALGDSVTAGAQMSRGSWGVKGADGVQFLYFAHLARLLEEHFGYKGIKPVQHGHGGWSAGQGLGVVDKEVVAEAEPGDLVILEFGANDIGGRGMAPAAWKADTKKLIARVKAKTDQIMVMTPTVGGAIPKNAAEITKVAQELVAEDKVAVADVTKLSMYRGEPFGWALLANQFHPDYMGHITIAEMLAPLLTEKHRNYPE